MSNRLTPGIGSDLVARAIVIVLFSLFSANLLGDFLRTGHVTGLLLLISESLVVVMTFIRRRTRFVDRSAAAVVTTALSLAGPPLLRASDGAGLMPDSATALVSGIGLILVIVAKLTLGRSFGIAPANRGIVMRGPYTIMRHPIYTGYLTTHVALWRTRSRVERAGDRDRRLGTGHSGAHRGARVELMPTTARIASAWPGIWCRESSDAHDPPTHGPTRPLPVK